MTTLLSIVLKARIMCNLNSVTEKVDNIKMIHTEFK